MIDYIWQVIILILTAATTGGLVHFFTLKSAKKRENAIADQEVEKVKEQSISNTESVIRLYKEALQDIKDLGDREKNQMAEVIKVQDKKIVELQSQINTNNEIIKTLNERVEMLTEQVNRLQKISEHQCPFISSCEKYNKFKNGK